MAKIKRKGPGNPAPKGVLKMVKIHTETTESKKAFCRDLVKRHILAEGPVSFSSIKRYVHEQSNVEMFDYHIVVELNQLIRQNVIDIYEDGRTFGPGDSRIDKKLEQLDSIVENGGLTVLAQWGALSRQVLQWVKGEQKSIFGEDDKGVEFTRY